MKKLKEENLKYKNSKKKKPSKSNYSEEEDEKGEYYSSTEEYEFFNDEDKDSNDDYSLSLINEKKEKEIQKMKIKEKKKLQKRKFFKFIKNKKIKDSVFEGLESSDGFADFRDCYETENLNEIANLFYYSKIYCRSSNAIYSISCFNNVRCFYNSDLFQLYSRLIPYNIIYISNNFPLVDLYDEYYLLNSKRNLNKEELKMFKIFENKRENIEKTEENKTKIEKKKININEDKTQERIIVTFNEFLDNLNNLFFYNEWKDEFDWEDFNLFGGSVLKCLLKETFESDGKQDLDFFYIGDDYYSFKKSIEIFRKNLENKGLECEDNEDTYVRTVSVKFNSKKDKNEKEKIAFQVNLKKLK